MTSIRKSSYALYHSMHELPWTVEHLLTPRGDSLALLARLSVETAHRLANSLVNFSTLLGIQGNKFFVHNL